MAWLGVDLSSATYYHNSRYIKWSTGGASDQPYYNDIRQPVTKLWRKATTGIAQYITAGKRGFFRRRRTSSCNLFSGCKKHGISNFLMRGICRFLIIKMGLNLGWMLLCTRSSRNGRLELLGCGVCSNITLKGNEPVPRFTDKNSRIGIIRIIIFSCCSSYWERTSEILVRLRTNLFSLLEIEIGHWWL